MALAVFCGLMNTPKAKCVVNISIQEIKLRLYVSTVQNVIIDPHPCNRGWIKLESPSFKYGCDDFAVSKVSPCRHGHMKVVYDGFSEQKV